MDLDYEKIVQYVRRRIRHEPMSETFPEEQKWLVEQMKNTIETGASNSALIVDVTKSSSTRMVEDAISYIKSKFNEHCSIIQLYGRLHSEAENAFHEIVENLSVDCSPDVEIMGSIAEKVDFVLKCIRNETENKPVIFILDEFDLFCDEVENTLIYPMIDVLHSKVPICLIGVTADQTCIQRLGKRVTSRFSSKIVYLESKNIFDRNLSAFQNLLCLDDSLFLGEFVAEWNSNVRNVAADPAITDLIKLLSERRFSEEDFRLVLFFVAARISVNKRHLTVEDVVDCVRSFFPQSCQIIDSLSALELCLIIAIQHHITYEKEAVFNFKVIFHRYNKIKLKSNNFTQMSEQQGKKAFESLMSLGIIKPLQAPTSALLEYIPFRFGLESVAVQDYIKNCVNVPDSLQQWLKNPLFCE